MFAVGVMLPETVDVRRSQVQEWNYKVRKRKLWRKDIVSSTRAESMSHLKGARIFLGVRTDGREQRAEGQERLTSKDSGEFGIGLYPWGPDDKMEDTREFEIDLTDQKQFINSAKEWKLDDLYEKDASYRRLKRNPMGIGKDIKKSELQGSNMGCHKGKRDSSQGKHSMISQVTPSLSNKQTLRLRKVAVRGWGHRVWFKSGSHKGSVLEPDGLSDELMGASSPIDTERDLTKGKKIKKLSLCQRCVEKQENIDVLPQLSCRERTTVRALLNVQRPVKIICDIPTCRQVNCKASLTTRSFWSNVKARKEEFNSYKYCSFVIVSEHFNNDCNYQSLSLSPVTLLQPECQHGSTRSAYVLTFQYSQGTALQKSCGSFPPEREAQQ
ncbi:hypothetical protein DY000_02056140 [Brassica cretica]|uniref:Uncharacterized protein n=1 Tax=Brassica cretica TaxID=69181 RepID=A0ABQ7AFH0_BRACR|nr:hypothetical protein DY000_02056140 [Brassica cretica]